MTYAELSESQARRSRQFAEAQTDAMSVYCDAERDLKELQAENAKLRELVRHMYTCMEHYESDGSISCDRCPLDNDTGNCDFERRMSELGVVK